MQMTGSYTLLPFNPRYDQTHVIGVTTRNFMGGTLHQITEIHNSVTTTTIKTTYHFHCIDLGAISVKLLRGKLVSDLENFVLLQRRSTRLPNLEHPKPVSIKTDWVG